MSVEVTKEEVKKIAQLARIGLTEDELATAVIDLANVLANFSEIQKIDTTNTPTSDDVTGLKNVSREDTAVPELLCKTDELMKRVPAVHQGQVKVKAVL